MMKLLTDLNLMTFYEKIKDIFASKTEMSSELAMKSDRDHNHDNRYYTESEVTDRLNNKSDTNHTHNNYVPRTTAGNISIHADNDASTTTEHVLIKAGHNELKVTSSGGGDTITKGHDKLTFNGNVVYHTGKKPTASDVGARPSSWVPSWTEIKNIPATFAPIIGTTNTTAFRGDYGNIAYTHSQQAHAPSSAQKNSDITKGEIEAKLTGSITTHNHNGQYYTKGEIDSQMSGKSATNHTHNNYVPKTTVGNISIHADNDASTTSEYALIKAGHNELKVTSSGGGDTITKGHDKLTFNGNVVYHTGNRPTSSDIGALSLTGGTVTGVTEFKQGTLIHKASNAGGTNGYLHVAEIKITSGYMNQPIYISYVQRGHEQINTLEILFENHVSNDPSIKKIIKTGKTNAYIHKSTTSTWNLYIQKTESWDTVDIIEFKKGSHDSGIKVTWKDVIVTELPEGYVTATLKDMLTNISGNATTATKLKNPIYINGTSFDGSENINTNKWGVDRNITIGNCIRTVNGGTNVTWTLDDIGVFGKQGEITNTTNWNNVKTPGVYKVQISAWGDGSLGCPNNLFPAIYSYGMLNVYKSNVPSEERTLQVYFPHKDGSDSESPILTRMFNGSNWNKWSKLGRGLNANDVGARSNSWVPSWTEIKNIPATFTPTLGTTNTTAFRGDYGNIAYTHSQQAHAPSTAQKNSDITKGEIEAKLTGSITTHNHNGQYYTKGEIDGQMANKAAASHMHNTLSSTSLVNKTVSLDSYNLSSGSPNIAYYHCPNDGGGSNITGRPNDSSKCAFYLRVELIRWGSTTDYVSMQTYVSYDNNTMFVRYCKNGTWTAWEKIYTSVKKPTASEVGARPSNWVPSWTEIKNIPGTFAPIIGTTNTTAFRGDYGNIAYTHSQQAHAPASAQKNSDITKGEIEAKLTGSITTHNHNGQYYTKGEIDSQMSGKSATSHTHSNYVPVSAGGNITIHADSDASTTTEYALIKAGHNELKVTSSGGTTTVTKGQDKLTFNGNVVYHAGKKPTASDVGARPSNWVPSWTEINNRPATFTPTLGTTNTTAFRGDYGNIAYTHSQSTHAPSNAQRNADITKGEIEAKLTGSITTHNHNGQYYTKAEVDAKLPGKITLENGELYITY